MYSYKSLRLLCLSFVVPVLPSLHSTQSLERDWTSYFFHYSKRNEQMCEQVGEILREGGQRWVVGSDKGRTAKTVYITGPIFVR